MKKRILIRVSGGKARGKQLGLGHVFRCLSLVDFLKPNKIAFLIEDFGGVENLLKKYGYKTIFAIKKDPGIDLDVKKTKEIIKNEKIDVLIVDKYRMPLSYFSKLENSCKIVALSDLDNIEFPVNLVVNGFIGFKNSKIKNKFGSTCLLGPKYQILNKNFFKKKRSKKNFRLIATFGGFDENNISKILVSRLNSIDAKFKTKIILGPATSFPKIKSTKKIKIVKYASNMQKEISEAEFGLCSGGITSYEFASQGIPFGIVCQEKHQLITAKEWHKKRLGMNLGLFKSQKHRLPKFLKIVQENNREFFRKNSSICDGNGAFRVAKVILTM